MKWNVELQIWQSDYSNTTVCTAYSLVPISLSLALKLTVFLLVEVMPELSSNVDGTQALPQKPLTHDRSTVNFRLQ